MASLKDILEYTAKGQYYKVYKDGAYVSQHTTEREAAQRAANTAYSYPDSKVHYTHEYEVTVALTDAGITEAKDYSQGADQPPEVVSTPTPIFQFGEADTYDISAHFTDDAQSVVTYGYTNTLPNGLSLDDDTGILTYDGLGTASVSQHQFTATDAVGVATTQTTQVVIGDFTNVGFDSLLGNVVTQFGADATGATNTSAELLAAFDSDHAIYIPPGEYKYSATFCNTTKPKLVWCFGERWLQTDVEISDRKNIKRLGEQTRFVAAANVDAVNVKSIMSWNGGQFDVQNVLPPNANKSAFNVDMNWLGGQYGGKFWNVATQADGSQINQDDTNGWHCVKVNFNTQTVNGARFEGWRCEIEQVKAFDGWLVSAYNPGFNQHSGLHTVNVNYSESYRAYYDAVSDYSWFSNLMQTQNGTFNSPAVQLATYAAVVLGPNNVGQDYGVQDFDPDGTGSVNAIHFGPYNKLELANTENSNPIFGQPRFVEQFINDIEMVIGDIT